MVYPGGKNGAGVYQTIINQIVPHEIYIEPFLGGGAIMRNKLPTIASVGIDADPAVIAAARSWGVPNLRLIEGDALDFLEQLGQDDQAFIYADPPYLKETRRSQADYYRFEFGARAQHKRLLELLVELPAKVGISGYPNRLYEHYLSGWRVVKYRTVVRSGVSVEEWLWCNYGEPWALHDYRYLGENKRKRQDFKRLVARWRRRLAEMDQLKRLALMAALDDGDDGRTAAYGHPETDPA